MLTPAGAPSIQSAAPAVQVQGRTFHVPTESELAAFIDALRDGTIPKRTAAAFLFENFVFFTGQ